MEHYYHNIYLKETLMYFPTWIDLKGEDSVPETVHHVVRIRILLIVTNKIAKIFDTHIFIF